MALRPYTHPVVFAGNSQTLSNVDRRSTFNIKLMHKPEGARIEGID